MNINEKEKLEALSKQTQEIHDALFKVPIGSSKNLIEKIVAVVAAYDRGSWAARILILGIPAIGGIILGWDRIVAFFKGGT